MPHPLEYWGNSLPKCPHCAADFQVWEGDNPLSLDYDDGGMTTFECGACNKEFVAVTKVEYTFATAVSEDAAYDDEWGPQEVDAA
jgi:hypothetical protein